MTPDLSQPYAADRTVADALQDYLDENGFGTEAYDAPSVSVTFWGFRFRLPNPPDRKRAVRLHDLHHVATGFGTDPAGEFEISAWEIRRGLRGLRWFVRSLVTGGALAGLLYCPRRALAAWRAAQGRGVTLFTANLETDYPEMMGWTVGELRAHLGIPREGIAGARGLHGDAPPAPDRATAARQSAAHIAAR